MRALFLALMIGSLAPPAAAQSVRDGIEAWQKGDTEAAVAIWKPLAEKGDADAAFNLGQAYRLGRGAPLDLARAQGWFERAARKGHVDAQATLGLLLFQNGNRVSAMRWLKGAAEAGEPRALLMMGTALYNGDGVPEDPVRAYAYVSRAAAQGLDAARATLADMDQVMPLEQRRKGVALARELASSPKPSASPTPPKKEASPAIVRQAATGPQPPNSTLPAAPGKASPALKTAEDGKWRIQLGAFSKRQSAEGLKARLASKLDGKQAYYVPAGAVVRLQVGPYASRAAATAACKALSPQPCFAVAAH